jgi:hypothetical protein
VDQMAVEQLFLLLEKVTQDAVHGGGKSAQ